MKSKICAVVLSGVCGFVFGHPSESSAWYARQHASGCFNSSDGQDVSDSATGSGVGSSGNNSLTCPFPDTDSTSKQTVRYGWVYGSLWSGPSGLWAKVCRKQISGNSGTCSGAINAVAAGAPGEAQIELTPNRFYWGSDENSFAYTFIRVPQGDSIYGIGYGS
jgi:hypothetical protein